ncbi:MAG: signal peptidase I [Anaerolineales bacterium]|nr:signal peptidase I [Anaerolineales bacterium]
MNAGPKFIKLALTTVSFILVIIAWMIFAPTQFGGDTSYIIVAGTSMLPRFKLGDLVLVKEKDRYGVGDIVAYQHPEIGPVFHRIVEQQGERFILQGDNNDFLDSYEPTQAEIIGLLWVHIPALGKFLVYLRSPFVFSVLVIAVGFISYISFFGDSTKQHSRRPTPKASGVPMNDKESITELFFVLAVIAIGSLILGIAAYTRPTQINTSEMVPYEHTGAFFYTAEAVDDIYDQEAIQPGEPLFRQLTDDFTVAFSYRLVSPDITTVEGSYEMVAIIRDTNGWKRTLPLEPETDFEGTNFTVSSSVDLDEVQAVLDTLEARTGYTRGQYTLSIQPVLNVTGKLGTESFKDTFTPTLNFIIDDVVVRVSNEEPGETPTMKFSQVGMLSRSIVVPNTIKIISFEMTVLTAQIISLVGLLLSAAPMLYLGIRMRKSGGQNTLPHLNPNLKAVIVSLENPTQLTSFLQGKTVADVSSFSDLLKVVERTQATIMHHSQGDLHHYYVQSDNLVYHYAVQAPAEEADWPTADSPEIEAIENPGFFKRLFSRSEAQNGDETITEEDINSLDDAMRKSFDQDKTKE